MPAKEFDTRAALLKSGKDEFLAHGFEKASLRVICANAHVTTGAFYSNFAKKEDFFRALVKDDLAAYYDVYEHLMDRALHVSTDDATTSIDSEMPIMDFVMGHRDLFKLLFDCSEGTPYEGFRDTLLARFDKGYQEFFDTHADAPIDHDVVRIIVRMKFSQYMEIIYGDYSKERVIYITQQLFRFTRGGFNAILHEEGPE